MNARLTGLLTALLFAPAAHAAEPRLDLYGDPLPEGAVARLGTLRFQTGETVRSAAFSPDGKRIATRCDRTFFVFDAETGRALRQLPFIAGEAGPWVWQPDGHGLLLLFDEPGNPCLVDFTRDGLHPSARGPGAAARQKAGSADLTPVQEPAGPFALSPDGKLVAAAAYDPQARRRFVGLWEAAPGKRFRDLKLVRSLGPPPGDCGEFGFTPDGKALGAFCSQDKKVGELFVLWDVRTGKERCRRGVRFPARAGGGAFALSPEGRQLAYHADTGTPRMLDLTEDTPPRAFEYPVGGDDDWAFVKALAFSPDGKRLLTAGRDNRVRLWDPVHLEATGQAADAEEWVGSIAFSPDGKRVVTGSQAGAVRQWDAGTFREVGAVPRHRGVVRGVAAAPDGKTAVTTGGDGTLRVWELATGRQLRQIDLNGRIGGGLGLAPDGKTVVVTVSETLQAWDTATGKAATLPGGLAGAIGISHGFGPDGKTLITGTEGTVTLWDFPAGRPRATFHLIGNAAPMESGMVYAASLSPDGKRLVTCACNRQAGPGNVDVWDTATRKWTARLDYFHVGGATPLFLPGERPPVLVARDVNLSLPGSAERSPALSLWDSQTGRPLQPFGLPAADAPDLRALFTRDVALAPDTRTLAVAREDGVLLYEVATGQGRLHLTGHRGGVLAVAFTPDGRRLITAGDDWTALVWDLTLPGAAARLPAPTEQERAVLWEKLVNAAARDAFEAMARLAADPAGAVALLRERLRPAPKPDLDRLVEQLDHNRFAVRQQASAELGKRGRAAIAAVRRRLEKEPSAEVRARLERFLDQKVWSGPTPEELRQGRAVELLEGIATPGARALLRELAEGDADAPLTREALAALRRLGQ